jgi:hypothetical protein
MQVLVRDNNVEQALRVLNADCVLGCYGSTMLRAASYGYSLATSVAAFVPDIISKRGSKSTILPLSILVKPMREARDCCLEIFTTTSGKRF